MTTNVLKKTYQQNEFVLLKHRGRRGQTPMRQSPLFGNDEDPARTKKIIPGITAASGASAYAGIPLTARGYSQNVQFLTFNPQSHYSPETGKQLAHSSDTLVFYMAAKNIADLAEILLRYSRKPATPLAVIEQATTVHQQVHITALQDCIVDFEGKNFSSPSLVIIGEVVKLHQQFNWYRNSVPGTIFRN